MDVAVENLKMLLIPESDCRTLETQQKTSVLSQSQDSKHIIHKLETQQEILVRFPNQES